MGTHPTTLFIMIVGAIGLYYLIKKKNNSHSRPHTHLTTQRTVDERILISKENQSNKTSQLSNPLDRLRNLLFLQSTICI